MRNVTVVFTALAALAVAGCATMNVSSHIERNGINDNQDRLEQQVDEEVTRMMMRLPRGGAALR